MIEYESFSDVRMPSFKYDIFDYDENIISTDKLANANNINLPLTSIET